MQEGVPTQNEGVPMEEKNEELKELVAQVREAFVQELIRHASQHTEAIGQETSFGKSLTDFAEKIRAKQSVRIGGPIEGDILDAILQAPPFSLGSGYGNERYQAVWKALEEGV